MRKKGKIASWNDEKGFGFITPVAGGDRTFVHIKAFANRDRRPSVGDVVTYSMSTDARGRPCADAATIAGTSKKIERKESAGTFSQILAIGFLFVVGGAVLVSAIPTLILLIYLAVSTATFGAYALDKAAAKKGHWRTTESTLHLLALIGGWPGALIAQTLMRHKTRKQPFRAIFWITVVLNCAAFAWLFTPEGANAWRSIIRIIA